MRVFCRRENPLFRNFYLGGILNEEEQQYLQARRVRHHGRAGCGAQPCEGRADAVRRLGHAAFDAAVRDGLRHARPEVGPCSLVCRVGHPARVRHHDGRRSGLGPYAGDADRYDPARLYPCLHGHRPCRRFPQQGLRRHLRRHRPRRVPALCLPPDLRRGDLCEPRAVRRVRRFVGRPPVALLPVLQRGVHAAGARHHDGRGDDPVPPAADPPHHGERDGVKLRLPNISESLRRAGGFFREKARRAGCAPRQNVL